MAGLQEHFERLFGQLPCQCLGITGLFQGMEQHLPAQGTDPMLEARVGLHQAFADGVQVFDRYRPQIRCVLGQPVAQYGFGADDDRRGVPQGVVEVEGDQLDGHESLPLLRLARGWALSYTVARC
ncbi:hypothetical protein D9M73_260290 [compost metagenome]